VCVCVCVSVYVCSRQCITACVCVCSRQTFCWMRMDMCVSPTSALPAIFSARNLTPQCKCYTDVAWSVCLSVCHTDVSRTSALPVTFSARNPTPPCKCYTDVAWSVCLSVCLSHQLSSECVVTSLLLVVILTLSASSC